MIVIWRFRINTFEYHGKITRCDTGKGEEYGYLFLQFCCHRWTFSQILTQMNKIIYDSYMLPRLSAIKYDITQDNYLKKKTLVKKKHLPRRNK